MGNKTHSTNRGLLLLSRFKIYFWLTPRPDDDPMPDGLTPDIRAHRDHLLSPTREMVHAFLAEPTLEAWNALEKMYAEMLESRFVTRRDEFDELAFTAMMCDVFLGCSCPTKTNSDVRKCHTVLAIKFMKEKYPDLPIEIPCPPAWTRVGEL